MIDCWSESVSWCDTEVESLTRTGFLAALFFYESLSKRNLDWTDERAARVETVSRVAKIPSFLGFYVNCMCNKINN